jgi:hypothetical protein
MSGRAELFQCGTAGEFNNKHPFRKPTDNQSVISKLLQNSIQKVFRIPPPRSRQSITVADEDRRSISLGKLVITPKYLTRNRQE